MYSLMEKLNHYYIILAINETLQREYGIVHSTIQMENVDIHPHGQYGKDFKLTHTSY